MIASIGLLIRLGHRRDLPGSVRLSRVRPLLASQLQL
jgi:hypothetical protein